MYGCGFTKPKRLFAHASESDAVVILRMVDGEATEAAAGDVPAAQANR